VRCALASVSPIYHFFLNLANRHPSVALVPFPNRSTATEKALVIHMADLSAYRKNAHCGRITRHSDKAPSIGTAAVACLRSLAVGNGAG